MTHYVFTARAEPDTVPGHKPRRPLQIRRTSTLQQKPETERTAADARALVEAEQKRMRRQRRNYGISLHGGYTA